jgi:hypothetical protein
MNRIYVKVTACVLAAVLLSATAVSTVEARSFFTARRTFGTLFLAGSLVMAKKAHTFRQDANELYDAYKVARNADEAEVLYRRTSDRDTKSQMSIGLSAVLLASGLRLLLTSGVDDNIPKLDRRLKLDVSGDARTQSVKVGLKRAF